MNSLITAVLLSSDHKLNEKIKSVFGASDGLNLLGTASQTEEAKRLIRAMGPDVLLYKPMPDPDAAFNLLDDLRESGARVIMLSEYANAAVRGYDYEVFDFVLLPLKIPRLKKALYRVRREMENGVSARLLTDMGRVVLPTPNGYDLIAVEDIIRCEAEGSYTIFHIKAGNVAVVRTVSRNLKEYVPILEKNNFFRVHRSHIVNMKFVSSYYKGRGGYLVLADNSQVVVSVRRKPELMKFFMDSEA